VAADQGSDLGSTTPDQVQAAMDQLGVELIGTAPNQIPRQERPPPSLEEHPTRPRTPGESALVAASEALVFRALERAGNRLRQSVAKPPGVPAYETHLYVTPTNGSANGCSTTPGRAPRRSSKGSPTTTRWCRC
jgi:hypothetical protein